MGTLVDVKQIKGLLERLQGCVHIYRDVTGTAVKTSSPRFSARWDVTDPEVTEYIDGMMVQILVPVAGHATYGTVLQINQLGYKPVVWDVNTGISKRYPVGSVVFATYNASQTAKAYLGSGQQNVDVTGCWQVMDYNANDNTTTIKVTFIGEIFTPAGTYGIQAKSILLEDAAGRLQSLTTTGGTATSKTRNPSGFLLGKMFYTAMSSGEITEGNLNASSLNLYDSNEVDFRYSSNCGSTLVAGKMLYLVGTIGDDGLFYLDEQTWWSQDLPAQADGKVYVFVGNVISATTVHMARFHTAYYHNGTHICIYGDGKNEVEVSTTEPTDPNVEVWIDPQGEADRKSAIKKDIIVARAIPETPMTGDRYFFSSFICVRTTPSRCQDLKENSQNWESRKTGNNSSEVTILSYKTDHSVLVTIKEDFTLDDFVTDESYMLSCCQDASNLTTRNTASPYFEIQGGKLVCIKRPKVELKNGNLTLLEGVKIAKENNGNFSVKKHKRGNGAVYQSRLRWRPKVRGIGIPQSEIRIRHAKTKRWSKANEEAKSTTFIVRGMARGRMSECALKFHRYEIKKGNETSDRVLQI